MNDLPPQSVPAPLSAPPAPLSYEEVEWAKRRCKTQKRPSPLRNMVERFLIEPSATGDEEASIAISSMVVVSAWSWRKHLLAMWALGRMPLSHHKKLQAIAALSDFLKKTTLPEFYKVALSWWLSIAVLVGLWFGISSGADSWLLLYLFLGSLCSFPFVWLAASLWGDLRFNLLRATAVEALGLIALPEGTEAITRAMYETAAVRQGSFDGRVRRAATVALPRVLASLTPEHYLEMGAGVVPNLSLLLDHVKEPLQLQILEALGKMGDGRAVLPLQRFLVKTKSLAARQAAQRILPILEKRQIHESAHNTLLRASSMPNDAASLLLRPSYGGYQDQTQQLLRPVDATSATFDLGEPLDLGDKEEKAD
ncbi:MAG: hypothetical protein NT023_14140 [Armatimonadetes bacterium]|nr:hypothetical protein [Armatimonadota bacterium]